MKHLRGQAGRFNGFKPFKAFNTVQALADLDLKERE